MYDLSVNSYHLGFIVYCIYGCGLSTVLINQSLIRLTPVMNSWIMKQKRPYTTININPATVYHFQ